MTGEAVAVIGAVAAGIGICSSRVLIHDGFEALTRLRAA
jgi:hypothetical protein